VTARLSVCVVTYCGDRDWLQRTLGSLAEAVRAARAAGLLDSVVLDVVDNGAGEAPVGPLEDLLDAGLQAMFERSAVQPMRRNLGFGAAHNHAIRSADSALHLVLNPDVELDRESLTLAMEALRREPDLVAVVPRAVDEQGRPGHLCKRYPTVLDLALRGFAPPWLRQRFAARLAAYEMHDLERDAELRRDVPLASGCCLLARTGALQRVGGFDEGFFLYFEDYDLSLRLRAHGRIAYLPQMRIVHAGGGAARKGGRHLRLFLRSAWRFFGLHGWRWWRPRQV
jgi:hypothetical protein